MRYYGGVSLYDMRDRNLGGEWREKLAGNGMEGAWKESLASKLF